MPQTAVGYNPGPRAYKPFQDFLLKDWVSGGSLTALARQINKQNTQANAGNYFLARLPNKSSSATGTDFAAAGSSGEKPSFISQVFDWASVPLHTTVNMVETMVTPNTDMQSAGNPLIDLAQEAAYDVKSHFGDLAAGAGALVTRAPEDSALATVLFPFQPLLEGGANLAMGKDFGSEAFEGYIDKHAPRTRSADLLKKIELFKTRPWLREAAGFAGDVALDPLTYVGGLGFAKRLKDIKNLPLDEMARRAAEAPEIRHTPDEILRNRAAGKYDVPFAAHPGAEPFTRAPEQFGQQAVREAVIRNVRQGGVPTAEAATQRIGGVPLTRYGDVENLFPESLGRQRPSFDPSTVKPLTVSEKVLPDRPTITRSEFVQAVDEPLGYDFKARVPRPADQVARQVDAMNLGAQMKKGQALDPKFGTYSQQNVINIFKEVMNGTIPRHVEQFPTAAGNAATHASKIAGQIAKDYKGAVDETIQVNMWNRIWRRTEQLAKEQGYKSLNSKGAFNWRLKTAQSMLRSAEDALIAAGHTPKHSTNIGLRLSNVLADMPNPQNVKELDGLVANFGIPNTKMIINPEVRKSIQRQMARRTVSNVDFVSRMSKYAAGTKMKIDKLLLDSVERRKMLDQIRLATEKAAKDSGMTAQEARTMRELVERNVDLPRTTPDSRIFTPEHGRQVEYGKVVPETIEKVDTQVAGRFATPWKKMKDKDGAAKGVAYTILERFGTWVGKGGMDRYAMDALHFAEQSALRRALTASRLLKEYTPEQLNQAIKILQNQLPKTDDIKVTGAVTALEKWTKELFGSPTLRDVHGKIIKQGSDGYAGRMNALMGDVNKELERMGFKSVKDFRFSGKKWVDKKTGKTWDFTPGGADGGWMQSWKAWDMGDDPATFLYNLDLALERVGKRYSFTEDMAARFARTTKSDEFVHAFDAKKYPLLEGRYFTKEGHDFLKKTLDDIEQGPWKPQMKATQFYATGLRVWKSGVTIYSPAHHIRNMIGDLFFTWSAGINDPRLFGKTAKVMNSSGRYKQAMREGDFDTLRELTDPERVQYLAGPDDVIFQKVINGKTVKLTANDIYVGAFSRGLLRDVNAIEELALDALPGVEGVSTKLAAMSPLKGGARAVATKTSQGREHYIRIHHFLGRVEQQVRKGRTDIAKIMDEAAHDVRKWHPDGSELTRLEQRLRLVFPFYSWTRKAMPLLIQTMVQAPAKVLAYPRLQYAASSAMGLQEGNEEGLLDPFPDSQLFPDWIRVGGIGPLGDPKAGGLSGFIGNFGETATNIEGENYGYTIAEPPGFSDLPPLALGADFLGMGEYNAPAKGLLNMLTPAAKIPMEVSMGNRIPTGIPIDYDPLGYGLEQVPILSYLTGVLNTTPKKQEKKGKLNQERLLSLLTAMNVKGTGPYIESAQIQAGE